MEIKDITDALIKSSVIHGYFGGLFLDENNKKYLVVNATIDMEKLLENIEALKERMTEKDFLEILESCDCDDCGGGYIAWWINRNDYQNIVIDGRYNITLLLQKLKEHA